MRLLRPCNPSGNLETYVEGISTKTATPIARQTAGGMLSSYSYSQKNGGAVQDQRHYQRLKRRA